MADPSSSSFREWNSTAYHRLSGPQVSWGKKVLSRLSLRGDETLLDAGCGTGRLTADLLQALPNGQVVAIDISQNMLATAQQELRPAWGNKVSFVAADFRSLPFRHAFDGIFSTASFHWVKDHDLLFRNLHQALKSGGWLRAQCGGGPNIASLLERVHALAETPAYAPFLRGYQDPWEFADAKTTAQRLERAGFTDIETSIEAAPVLLSGAQEYCDFVQTMILRLHLPRLPEERLRRELLKKLAEQAAADDPPFSIDYWRLNLSGRVA